MEGNIEDKSTETVEQITTPPAPSKNNKKTLGLIITTIVSILLAVGGIIYGAFTTTEANKNAAENAELRSKIDLIKIETGANFVEKTENGTTITTVETTTSEHKEVQEIVNKVYKALSESIEGHYYDTVYGEGYATGGSMIKISDKGVYTYSNESYGVSSTISSYDSKANDVIENFHKVSESILTENGFTEDKELMAGKLYVNKDKGMYCSVTEGGIPSSIGCAKETWISEEDKKLFLKLSELSNSWLVFAKDDDVKDSTISPYQRLTASGPNAALLFYRTSPDADWQFFTGTQATLSCDEYNTEDIRKAFAGDTCYDAEIGQTKTVNP